MCKRNCQKRGFTLIELLVVISIIALLLAILMPALNKVKMQGQAVVCGSQAKQVALANMLYTQDYKGWICPPWTFQFGITNNLKPGSPNYANTWNWQWNTFKANVSVDGVLIQNMSAGQMQEKVFKTGWLYPYLNNSKIWLCPGAPRQKPQAATGSVVFGCPPFWSYTCNGTPGWSQPSGYVGNLSIKVENIKPGPAQVFLYMEQNRNTSTDRSTWDASPFDNTVTLMARWFKGSGIDTLSEMHKGGGTLTYYDGHVQSMKRTEFLTKLSTNEGARGFAGNYK
jgi:prepilin-type N-terminal cleavage/methylation domain-containing protein/prepilin-type processing-associated H-X9-DG protein